jgi:hypothetical protein
MGVEIDSVKTYASLYAFLVLSSVIMFVQEVVRVASVGRKIENEGEKRKKRQL